MTRPNVNHVHIPPGEADTYALVLDHAIARLAQHGGEKFTLHQLKALRGLLAGGENPRPAVFTNRDLNILQSCADWLETRSRAFAMKNYEGLMQGYSAKLKDLRERLAPLAVEKPVTLDEIFGKDKQ